MTASTPLPPNSSAGSSRSNRSAKSGQRPAKSPKPTSSSAPDDSSATATPTTATIAELMSRPSPLRPSDAIGRSLIPPPPPPPADPLADAAWVARNRPAMLARLHPQGFRNLLAIDARDPTPLGRRQEPFQTRDFRVLDAAWMSLIGRTASLPPAIATDLEVKPPTSGIPRRFWIERPRGHSKTTDTAAMLLWVLLTSPHRLRGIAAAADRDQARLLLGQIETLARLNPTLAAGLTIHRDAATHPATGSRLEVISSDAASSYGTIADFIVCDELSHWKCADLWHSLYTAAAKQPHTLLAVLTNAGDGRDWRWTARETARLSHRGEIGDGQAAARWHFSSLSQPEASWIDPAFLDEQKLALPDPVFRRLWLNQWQHRSGGFLTAEEVRLCRDADLRPQFQGTPGIEYVAAVDYAEKTDRTAAIICHAEPAATGSDGRPIARPRIVVDRLDVVAPQPGAPVPIAWVDDWIERTLATFPSVRLVVDAHQLVGTIQRFEPLAPIVRFDFAGGFGNDRLARHLRSLIVSRDVGWYEHAGVITHRPGTAHVGPIPAEGASDDLESELCELRVIEKHNGRLRFDHPVGGHDDRAFVLAVACQELLRTPLASPDRFDLLELPRGLDVIDRL